MEPIDPTLDPAAERQVQFQLASFALDRSNADSVIMVFIYGPSAEVSFAMPHAQLGSIPQMLYSSAHNMADQLVGMADVLDPADAKELLAKLDEFKRKIQPH